MNNELFNELLASVREMDVFIQGKTTSVRVTEFPESQHTVRLLHMLTFPK